ncbi:MAG: CRTAC1 family protein [Fuerstiella sp.]|nr:CRTAC1 family protein [Fuerstiella sp.]
MGDLSGNRVAGLCLAILTCGCGTHQQVPENRPSGEETTEEFVLTDVAMHWGIDFEDSPRHLGEFRLPAIMGSGCAVLDFDRNGLLDILLIAADSEQNNCALYSQKKIGTFVNLADELGIKQLQGTGVAVGDCNNDAWPDLYVTSDGSDSLWLNVDGSEFRNITQSSGISNQRWGVSACWVDYDRDGWLDLFVTNYVDYQHQSCTRLGGGGADFCGPHLFPLTPDLLLRNITGTNGGHVAFADVSEASGISSGLSAGLGVTAKDFTGDGWPDIYVASDQHPNLLWVNHEGEFVNDSVLRGCDTDFKGHAQASMGLALGDIDHDGTEDLVVSHLDGEAHAVYSEDSAGFFTDRSRETGVAAPTRHATGFGISAADFNLDGRSELFTANGRVKRPDNASSSVDFWEPYRQPLQHLMPIDRQYQDGAVPLSTHLARGLAVGDLDRDGDPDMVISTIGERSVVLRNMRQNANRWVVLRVVDLHHGGRSCPGARLFFSSTNGDFERTFQPCQSYAGTNADEIYVGLGLNNRIHTIDIVWPDGDLTAEQFDMQNRINEIVPLIRGEGKLVNEHVHLD